MFGITELYFFKDEIGSAVTVTSDRYVHMVNEFLFPELSCRDTDLATIRQEPVGPTAHTARQSTNTLRAPYTLSSTVKFNCVKKKKTARNTELMFFGTVQVSRQVCQFCVSSCACDYGE